jgi:hypothetical protein
MISSYLLIYHRRQQNICIHFYFMTERKIDNGQKKDRQWTKERKTDKRKIDNDLQISTERTNTRTTKFRGRNQVLWKCKEFLRHY